MFLPMASRMRQVPSLWRKRNSSVPVAPGVPRRLWIRAIALAASSSGKNSKALWPSSSWGS